MAIDPTLARGVQQAQIAPNLKAGFGLGQAIADEPTRKKRLGLGLREDQRNDKRSRIQDMQNTAIAAYQVLGDNFDVNSLNVDNVDGTIDRLSSFVEIESSGDRGQDVQALINMYQGGKNLSQAKMAAKGGAAGYDNVKTINGALYGINKATNTFEAVPTKKGASESLAIEQKKSTSAKEKEQEGVLFDKAGTLRKEYESVTKSPRSIVNSYETFKALKDGDSQLISEFADDYGLFAETIDPETGEAVSEEQKNKIMGDAQALNDIALIFAYFKMVDPTSTVREGEFATVDNSGGVSTRMANMYNKMLRGERLNKTQRAQIYRLADNKVKSAENSIKNAQNKYSSIAQKGGIDSALLGFSGGDPARPVMPAFKNAEDSKAYDWAKSNSNDPRAKKILDRLGVQ